MPGHVFLRLAPSGMSTIAGRLDDGVALISATNGKTTTGAMLAAILAPERRLCRNVSGANLMSGVAATLVGCSSDATQAVLEVDEAALPAVVDALHPRVIALGNLFRDQLDRHGELEMVADRWRAMVSDLPVDTTLVLGADDPVIDDLGQDRTNVVRCGIDDPAVAIDGRGSAADSMFCVRCGTAYAFASQWFGHLGSFACPACGHARGDLDFAARDIRLQGISGTTFRVDAPDGSHEVILPLPGLYNVENALAAVATAYVLGVPTSQAVLRLQGFNAAFGRFERIAMDGREVVLLLFKNPTGANEALRAVRPEVAGAQVVLALNDRIADGRDVSWIWDIDLEQALDTAAGVTCAGSRAADLAVRLRYAGLAPDRIVVASADVDAALTAAVAATPLAGRVFVLATYTAMLDLHRVLAARGLTEPFWQEHA
jgi:UDP-N-acetylmuramyl tripeptide synthase